MSSDNKKETILKKLDELMAIAADVDKTLAKDLKDYRERFLGTEYRVVLLGRYSTGKSTFLNALLGRELLPSRPTPTNRTFVEIRHGEHPKAFRIVEDGGDNELRMDDIRTYAAEVAPPGTRLRVLVNQEILREGVFFVDTPGLEDPDLNVSKITYSEIPLADAVLFFLDAKNGPISHPELEFIEKHLLTDDRNRKLFVLVNKIDRLESQQQIDDAIGYVAEHLRPILGSPQMYPVSALTALEGRMECKPDLVEASGITEVERSLEDFFNKGRKADEHRRMLVLLSAAAASIEEAVRAQQQALKMTLEERQRSRTNLLAKRNDEMKVLTDQIGDLEERCKRTLRDLQRELRSFIDKLKRKMEVAINQLPYEQLKRVDLMEQAISSELKSFVESVLPKMESELRSDNVERSSEAAPTFDGAQVQLQMELNQDPVLMRNPEIATIGLLVIGWPLMGLMSWAAAALALAFGRQALEDTVRRISETAALKQIRPALIREVHERLDGIGAKILSSCSESLKQIEQQESEVLRKLADLRLTPIRAQLHQLEDCGASEEDTRILAERLQRLLEGVSGIRIECAAVKSEATYV